MTTTPSKIFAISDINQVDLRPGGIKELIGSFNADNISHTSHIIGGVIGAIFGFALAGRKATKETNAKDILNQL